MNCTRILYYILLVLVPLSCSAPRADNQEKEVWLTIFIHGIMSVKPHLTPTNFVRFIRDTVDDTIYAKTVLNMRNDPYFYQNQAMQQLGLHKINSTTITKGNTAAILASVFETVDSFVNASIPIENHYYTFGWSGLVTQKHRVHDAQHLYQALCHEVAQFQQRGVQPKIRLIGYSHGGNVCLCLALARQTGKCDQPLVIDETILLGMPVQKETDYLINDPIFRRIYHIYSRRDRIQKLDFFSTQRFFSRRIFKPRKGFSLPDKLLQIQLKCTRENASRTRNNKRLRAVYNMQDPATVSGKSRYLRDASPGHTELWFFGWTPLHYSKKFPLYPLPAVALVPIIVKIAQDFDGRQIMERPTLVDIRPEHELVLISNQNTQRVLTIMKFLPRHELQILQDKAMQYAPDSYPEKNYLAHMDQAYKKARAEHREKRKKRRSFIQ